MAQKLTQQQFLERARAVHGERYDYSQSTYTGSNDKITVICPAHGPFGLAARIHLQGRGCRACAGNARLDTATFVEKAKQFHGDKYDYSRALYKSNVAKLWIGCPEHGFFEQQASTHYKHGCPQCSLVIKGSKRSKGQAAFVAEAQRMHGSKYDYSQTAYINGQTRITIICPAHGPFALLPNSHLLVGSGCPDCRPARAHPARIAKSRREFEAACKQMHGEKYDYTSTVFEGFNRGHVTIICPVHGAFTQNPRSHMTGMGCQRCGALRNGKVRRDTSASAFEQNARATHGTTYDYSRVVYKGDRVKVEIICSVHGSFRQPPGAHIRGAGCQRCALEKTAASRRSSTAKFIEKAIEIHENTYDYSSVYYHSAHKSVNIRCAVHGLFAQRPATHLSGAGCPECGVIRSKQASRLLWHEKANGRLAKLHLLEMRDKHEVFYKVGITLRDVKSRYARLALINGYSYDVLALYTSANALAVYDWEQSILITFAHLRYTPKQPFGGASECFSSADEILAVFPVAG